MKRFKFPALALVALVTLLAACEKDPTTIGVGVIGGQPFTTDRAVFDVFADNKKIEAVRTNRLPIYQLGVYDHPVYGRTEARITSQVQLSTVNPLFGDERPEDEEAPENETIDSVYLYIPYSTNPAGDADLDGLPDAFEEPEGIGNPNSDTDGDGLTDNQERTRGTNPLSDDTDGDGIKDGEDDDFVQGQFKRTFDLDSIYGDREMPFRLRLQRSEFFLRDLDPNTNFQEAQEYFSNQDFSSFVSDEMIYDDMVTIDEKDILLSREDDPATENVDESEQFQRLEPGPGIRVALDNEFFQENILGKEGSSELLTQANFDDYLRGIQFSIEPAAGQELMMLFNLTRANITMSYSYTADGETKNKDFVFNFITQARNQQQQLLPIVGNAVNTFANEAYPAEIADGIASDENAERIYIKGGAGSYAEINLFDDDNGREAISQIRANNWIVNEANLTFYVDAVPEVVQPPRLYLYSTASDRPLIGRADAPVQNDNLGSFPFYDGLLRGDGSANDPYRYTVKITDYINDLVIREADNATLGLTLTPNISLFDTSGAMLEDGTETNLPVGATLSPLGTVLFGSNVSDADADKKLQLEIFYTEAN